MTIRNLVPSAAAQIVFDSVPIARDAIVAGASQTARDTASMMW